ncbi:MAG: hypothetical protein HY055_08225 [Magnetospirillum sp.]|nr:hypothetical protein [Magnetospirillum sp.]
MLGPAELREIYESLKGMGLEPVRLPEGRSPYLSPAFAAGMAVAKAVRGVPQKVPAASGDDKAG